MNKLNKAYPILLFVTVAIISYSLVVSRYVDKRLTASQQPQTSVICTSVFTLKEFEGKIAVFTSDSQQPIQILDRKLDELPEEDKALISEGITAVSESQLQSLIEDYSS